VAIINQFTYLGMPQSVRVGPSCVCCMNRVGIGGGSCRKSLG
jgi:hypothetical protein